MLIICLIVRHDRSKLDKLKEELRKSFEIKDLRPARQNLGIETLVTEKEGRYDYHREV